MDRGREAVRDGIADDDVAIHREDEAFGGAAVARGRRHDNSALPAAAPYLIVSAARPRASQPACSMMVRCSAPAHRIGASVASMTPNNPMRIKELTHAPNGMVLANSWPRPGLLGRPFTISGHNQQIRRDQWQSADVFKTIKENEVKFVDLRFTDTKGKEQHVTVPDQVLRRQTSSRTATRSTAPRSPAGRASRPPTCCSCRIRIRRAWIPSTTSRRSCSRATCSSLRRCKGYERDPRTIAKKRRGVSQELAASATPRTSAPSPSSSSSTRSSGRSTCRAAR